MCAAVWDTARKPSTKLQSGCWAPKLKLHVWGDTFFLQLSVRVVTMAKQKVDIHCCKSPLIDEDRTVAVSKPYNIMLCMGGEGAGQQSLLSGECPDVLAGDDNDIVQTYQSPRFVVSMKF